MTKLRYILLGLVLLLFHGAAQNIVIKDTNFRRCLVATNPSTIDINGDLIISEAQKVTSISCALYNITALDELKYFSALRSLIVPKNPITTFPVFADPSSLIAINVGETQITALPDLSVFPNLDYLAVHKLSLTKFPDLSQNIKLMELIVSTNNFDSIPTLNLPNLEYLDVSLTKLTKLPNLSNFKKLRQLDCYRNKIVQFPDFSVFDSLRMIDASTNNVSVFPKLPSKIETLYLDNNLFDTLPSLQTYTKLTDVRLYNNKLTFGDLLPLASYPNYLNVFKLSPQKAISVGYVNTVVEKDAAYMGVQTDLAVSGVLRNWYHNGLMTGKTNSFYQIDSMSMTDAGTYNCKLTHNLFPGLELSTDDFSLNYVPCVNESGLTKQITNANCLKQASVELKLTNQPKSNYTFQLKGINTGKSFVSNTGNFVNLTEPAYQLTILGARACKHILKDTLKISRDDCKQIVITPNGDEVDDEYFFSQTGTVQVVDKWGSQLGQFTIPKLWDAKLNGNYIPVGSYIVVINNGSEVLNLTVIY